MAHPRTEGAPALRLHIDIQSVEEVRSSRGVARMIRFGGVADGPYFRGAILPGGVDTQREADGAGGLSARYMLEGVDSAGEKCRIFIENEAAFGDAWTRPTLLTDSAALRWLESAPKAGRIVTEDGKLTILIYAEP